VSACRDDAAHAPALTPALDEPGAAWTLARRLSPRARVRVADVDAAGRVLNRYPGQAPLSGPAPTRPYAVYLADSRRRYRLLGFDLDADHGPVAADVDELRRLLRRAGMGAHVVCASGPGGGRHVWVGLALPVPAEKVDVLARALAARLPSLDISPLTNPVTGCLRPPGAPHRTGRRSEVVDGDLTDLLSPTAGPAHVDALLTLLPASPARGPATGRRTVTHDAAGHPWIPGDRRGLTTAAAAALHGPLPCAADTSSVLWVALCGAARAHWQLGDLIPLLDAAPGLEHARTGRQGPVRAARSRREQLAVLSRQWGKAVTHVAAHTEGTGGDPTFEPRCAAVVAAVEATQARADAAPGRWARAGGPSDRRVLDAACEQSLAAVRLDVELDIRRLGDLCGISRETARRALQRLAYDGWLSLAGPAEGPRPARWALPELPPGASTGSVGTGVSQAVPRPPGPLVTRQAWAHALARRRTDVAHDVFTPTPGLGHHCSRVYAALTGDGQPLWMLALSLGYSPNRVERYLQVLDDRGLARPADRGTWRRTGAERTAVARDLGANGVLARRRRCHRSERELWAWWLDELGWMHLPRAQKRRRRDPAPGQTVLPLAMLTARHRHGAHPRRRDGRADFVAAAATVRGTGDPAAADETTSVA
jgi:hypothetical protein